MIVYKFGGSSVKDAKAMKHVSSLIKKALPKLKVVVVSATQHTTNELEAIFYSSQNSLSESLSKLDLLKKRHEDIFNELEISLNEKHKFDEIFFELTALLTMLFEVKCHSDQFLDQVYSIGERVSSLLLALYLQKNFIACNLIDARTMIKTNNHFREATPHRNLIAKNVQSLSLDNLVITQGFIGSSENGETTTLGREGSDYSAVLFAEAIKAESVVIWTDVSGIASADPRIISHPNYLKEMSYEEATALASHGAKVLYKKTLEPAVALNIPVWVKNTNKPLDPGTVIHNKVTSSHSTIKAMTFALKGPDLVEFTFVGSHLPIDLFLAKGLDVLEHREHYVVVALYHPQMDIKSEFKKLYQEFFPIVSK